MVRRMNEKSDPRGRGDPERRDRDGEVAMANDLPAWEPWRRETPRMSLASRLEADRHFMARVAHWLFIKGGMVVLVISGLIVLGLVAGIPH